MRVFNGISHGINVGCGSFQEFVYEYASGFTYLQTGLFGQCCFRTHSYGEDHYVCFYVAAVSKLYTNSGIGPFKGNETFDCLIQMQSNVFLIKVLVD